MMTAENRCPLCGAPSFRTWRFGLHQCTGCALIVDRAIWKPLANEEMEETFFGEEFAVDPSSWQKFFERVNNRRTMKRILAMTSPPGDLLEIGIGSGSFLSSARRSGFTVLGCDMSKAVCARAERVEDLRVHHGTLQSLPGEVRFDVVVMNHVLEHVGAPLSLLDAAARRLKPGGKLHLAVPNVASWEASLRGWNSYEPYHLLYFTPRTLREAVERSGFEIDYLGTHESFSGWFLAILRTVFGSHGATAAKADRRPRRESLGRFEFPYRLAMISLGLVSTPLRRFQQWLGRGDEVILLASKPGHDR